MLKHVQFLSHGKPEPLIGIWLPRTVTITKNPCILMEVKHSWRKESVGIYLLMFRLTLLVSWWNIFFFFWNNTACYMYPSQPNIIFPSRKHISMVSKLARCLNRSCLSFLKVNVYVYTFVLRLSFYLFYSTCTMVLLLFFAMVISTLMLQ